MASHLDPCVTDDNPQGVSDWLCAKSLVCIPGNVPWQPKRDDGRDFCSCSSFWGLEWDASVEDCVLGPTYRYYLGMGTIISFAALIMIYFALKVVFRIWKAPGQSRAEALAFSAYFSILGCIFVIIQNALLPMRAHQALDEDFVENGPYGNRKAVRMWRGIFVVYACLLTFFTASCLILAVAWGAVLISTRTLTDSSKNIRKGVKFLKIFVVVTLCALIIAVSIGTPLMLAAPGVVSSAATIAVFSFTAHKLAAVVENASKGLPDSSLKPTSTSKQSSAANSASGSRQLALSTDSTGSKSPKATNSSVNTVSSSSRKAQLVEVAQRMRKTAIAVAILMSFATALSLVHVTPNWRFFYPEAENGFGSISLILLNALIMGSCAPVVKYLYTSTKVPGQQSSVKVSSAKGSAKGKTGSPKGSQKSEKAATSS